MSGTLYYVADPMCSWCYGFAPVFDAFCERLPEDAAPRWVMGGLAADSAEPMPAETQAYVQDHWRAVEARTGARFNWDFWELCEPRRSTFPACRAVLAAETLRPGAGPALFARIQTAYYREARNPSLVDVLVELASELEPALPAEEFRATLASEGVAARFAEDRALARRLGVGAFPSLVWEREGDVRLLVRGYEPLAVAWSRYEAARS